MPWRILRFIHHQFFIRHRKGRAIHSPYLFEFLHDVVFNSAKREVPAWLQEQHRNLREDRTVIPEDRLLTRSYAKRSREKAKHTREKAKHTMEKAKHTGEEQPQAGQAEGRGAVSSPVSIRKYGYGAGSRVDLSEERCVGSFVRGSSVSEKYGSLLFRITEWCRPQMILELGTGLGVSTLYLAAGHPKVPLHTMEGNTERAAFAAQLFCRNHLEQVSIHWGDLEENLEEILPQLAGCFVAFLDANHRYEPTIRYVRAIIERAEAEAVVVMDDIYWSREMYRAWKEVVSWQEVRMSIDLFRMGILLLRKDLQKRHLKINF